MGPDTCYEKCGDGRNDGMWECDDWNQYDGDGCNSTCYIETGWQCTGGAAANASPDTCVEICGDGLWLGQYACDDGNTINGDGCDSTCNIEAGWSCIYPDYLYCYKAYRAALINWNITRNNSYIILQYNTTFTLDSTLEIPLDLEIEITGPKPFYNFTYEIENFDTRTGTPDDHIAIQITYYDQQFFGYDLEDLAVTIHS